MQNIGIIKRSHRKHKTQKSESEEYDSLGSDTESGSGDHIRSRLDQSMHLDDHEPTSFISKFYYTIRSIRKISNNFFFYILLFRQNTAQNDGQLSAIT